MKHQLELNCLDDGRKFLNYWDAMHGNDVVCEIVDGKLMLEDEEISLQEFIERVEASNDMRTV